MPRGKKNTYDVYRLTASTAVLVAEDVDRKNLKEDFGIMGTHITYAAKTQRPVAGKHGKYRIRIHTSKAAEKITRVQTIKHVSTLKTSSGCRFGG